MILVEILIKFGIGFGITLVVGLAVLGNLKDDRLDPR